MIITVDTNKESPEGLRRAAKLLGELAQAKEGGDLAEEISEVEEVADMMTRPSFPAAPAPTPAKPVEQKKPATIAGGIQVY